MTFADLKSPVLLTLLGVFAAGWLALYSIMTARVSATEANALTLHGQQGADLQAYRDTLQSINNHLMTVSGALGRIEERSKALEKLEKDVEEIKNLLNHPRRVDIGPVVPPMPADGD